MNATTAADYIAAGAAALGVGSELVDPAALARGDDAVLTDRARELVAVVRKARGLARRCSTRSSAMYADLC